VCQRQLGRGLIAPRERRRIGILRLLELIGSDQILRVLGPIAIELLLREAQAVGGGLKRSFGARDLLLRIGRIQSCQYLPLMNRVAESHDALD